MTTASQYAGTIRQFYKVPDVHQVNKNLKEQYGENAEKLLREMGSALGVMLMNELAPITEAMFETDPEGLSQARSAFESYLKAADSYDDVPPSPFTRRTEHGHPLIVVGNRLAAVVNAIRRGDTVSQVRWYAGVGTHASDSRSVRILAAAPADNHYHVAVIGCYGDSEQAADEVAVAVAMGPGALKFKRTPVWGGGFWEHTDLTEFDPLVAP